MENTHLRSTSVGLQAEFRSYLASLRHFFYFSHFRSEALLHILLVWRIYTLVISLIRKHTNGNSLISHFVNQSTDFSFLFYSILCPLEFVRFIPGKSGCLIQNMIQLQFIYSRRALKLKKGQSRKTHPFAALYYIT